ncbi:MAG: ECF transporter S component [Clostridiaceae bacterium]|nr:ECF transporter S component [Clostridiaceae bacterium]
MSNKTKKLVMTGLLTAIVVVLQLVSSTIKIGPFSITLALVPIVVGAALYGKLAGAWLGGVFGLMVLLSGDAGAFLAVNIPGTIVTVMLKGILAGFMSGLVYDLLKKKNDTLATYVSGIFTPIVNTGIFVLGCFAFFMPTIREWANGSGETNAIKYIFVGMIGINFFIELAVGLVFSPSIARIIKIGRKEKLDS